MAPEDYDRVDYNEDGSVFYGYDDEDVGKTFWYDEDNNLDSCTDTPYDD